MALEFNSAIISAEFGIKRGIPFYSGGLGILAGDWLKSAADIGLPVVGVGISYQKGYFKQRLNDCGWQCEDPAQFNPEEYGFRLTNARAIIHISGRDVAVGAYEYKIKGKKIDIPFYALTTNLPENTEFDRGLTSRLYENGDNKEYFRTAQYRVLAAGVRILQGLGYDIETYHLNEGHGALVTLELLKQGLNQEQVKEKCWFTTHTPVEFAFDHFSMQQVKYALPEKECETLLPYLVYFDKQPYLGTAELAVALSRGVNAVSKTHAEVSSKMDIFKGVDIVPITNGIHLPTWVNPGNAALYKSKFPGIFDNPERFKEADSLDYGLFRETHKKAQCDLFGLIQDLTGVKFEPGYLTIGFARRGVDYKRADLILHDLPDLARIIKDKAQIVFSGKAHPTDTASKKLIQKVWAACNELSEKYGIKAVYLAEYDMGIAEKLVQGADLWLNNPRRPQEACGTSGMKVAANGGINLSVLDGWWAEAYNKGNGFAIAPDNHDNNYEIDSKAIRESLEKQILPKFGGKEWEEMVKNSIKLAAFFNTDRNVREYNQLVYKNKSLEEITAPVC
jgi:glycogen phosphorylase